VNVPVLRTVRLRLRGLERGDTDAILRVFADPEMSRFLPADFSDPGQCRAMIDRRLAYGGPDGLGHWVFELDGTVIGLGHLRPSWELPGGVPEIGYYVERARGGQGLATEAAAALLEYGLGALGLPAVWALVHEDNAAGLRVAQRLGFLDVGGGIHCGGPHRVSVALPRTPGGAHHIELWVPDLARAEASLGWLFLELGRREYQRWSDGVSWKLGGTYVVVERSPALVGDSHDRLRPGLNHLALHAGDPARVDELAAAAPRHGWRALFPQRYPHAGGPEHYAAYLENEDGFEIELGRGTRARLDPSGHSAGLIDLYTPDHAQTPGPAADRFSHRYRRGRRRPGRRVLTGARGATGRGRRVGGHRWCHRRCARDDSRAGRRPAHRRGRTREPGDGGRGR
jgi:RimJ/RimL family protein N-acetyltransferase